MTGSVILDVIIGLVFIYLLYSMLATIIQELIATKLAFRSKVLEKAILRMLEDGKSTTKYRIGDRLKGFWHLLGKPNMLKDKKIAPWFYAHPLIKYLGEDNFYSKPAYISAQNFSKVILDLLHGIEGEDQINILKIKNSIQNGTIKTLNIEKTIDKNNPAIEALNLQSNQSGIETINKDTALFLQSLWKDAEGDIEKFRLKLEQWFDDTMERASGWYKRYTKYILFVFGLLIAVGFNVDSIAIAKKLARDPKLRQQLVENADNYLKRKQQSGAELQQMRDKGFDTATKSKVFFAEAKSNDDSLSKKSKELVDSANSMISGDIKNVNELLGLGYNCHHPVLLHIFFFAYDDASFINFTGWFLTALAISMGAPFWFDLLNKLINLRSTGARINSSSGNAATNQTTSAQPLTVNVNTNSGEGAVG
jgi:hypothetical protein